MRQAVLFDVGGPIDLEIAYERMIDAALRAASGADEAALRAASARAVARFAPNAYRAVLFDLMGDAAPAAWARLVAGLPPPPPIELRPGMAALLGGLAARGVRLGLAANQPASVLARLAAAGLDGVFTGIALSGTSGFA